MPQQYTKATSHTQAAAVSEPVALWHTRCGAATASAIAVANGWLQQEFNAADTQLNFLRDSPSSLLRNSHYTHSQTGMFREGGNIPPLWTKGRGQDTVVIGITWLDEYQGVLTRAGGAITQLADLRGKRLAVPVRADAVIDFQRGSAEHGFETSLRLANIALDEVTLVEVAAGTSAQGERLPMYAAEVAALQEGSVDAIFVRFARGYQLAQDARFHQLVNINELPDHLLRVNNGTPRPITVDRDFLERHPDLVVRYLTVLLEAADWAKHNPNAIADILRSDAGGVSREEIWASHGRDVHLQFEPSLIPEYVLGLEVQKDFLQRWGYIEQDFSVRNWIEFWPLAQAQKLFAERKAQGLSFKAA